MITINPILRILILLIPSAIVLVGIIQSGRNYKKLIVRVQKLENDIELSENQIKCIVTGLAIEEHIRENKYNIKLLVEKGFIGNGTYKLVNRKTGKLLCAKSFMSVRKQPEAISEIYEFLKTSIKKGEFVINHKLVDEFRKVSDEDKVAFVADRFGIDNIAGYSKLKNILLPAKKGAK